MSGHTIGSQFPSDVGIVPVRLLSADGEEDHFITQHQKPADAAQDTMLLAMEVDANKIIGQRAQGSIWQRAAEAVVGEPLHTAAGAMTARDSADIHAVLAAAICPVADNSTCDRLAPQAQSRPTFIVLHASEQESLRLRHAGAPTTGDSTSDEIPEEICCTLTTYATLC